MGTVDPAELFYHGSRERFTDADSITLPNGTVYSGEMLRAHIGNELARVLCEADEKDFQRNTCVSDYARTTEKPGRVREDDEWQPHQAESWQEAMHAMHDLKCPAMPFSVSASEALDKLGTDADVPNDLSSLDYGDGPATV